MTNENISGFLNSIAEAKRAFDAEPEYQRQIAELERDKQRLGETVASRELRIHQLKQDQETLTQRLRSAEVERDDAGFRALEEADRVSSLLTLVRGFVGDGLKAISAVEGQEQIVVSRAALDRDHDELANEKRLTEALEDKIKEGEAQLAALHEDMRLAQEQLTRPFAGATSSSSGDTKDPSSLRHDMFPEPEYYQKDQRVADPTTAPTPSSAEPQEVSNASSVGSGSTETDGIGRQLIEPTGQSVVDPIAATVATGSGAGAYHSPVTTFSDVSLLGEGQSDGPFASNVTSGNTSEPVIVSSPSVESETSVVSSASQTPPERNRDESTRFKGRKYYDVTYFVPLHEWLSKGGTREDYDWRPLPDANRASNFS